MRAFSFASFSFDDKENEDVIKGISMLNQSNLPFEKKMSQLLTAGQVLIKIPDLGWLRNSKYEEQK